MAAKQQKWQDIMQAAEQNDISTVMVQASLDEIKRLVDERKMDIRQPNEDCFGNTPIHEAARLDRLGILKYFIEEKDGDVDVRNEFGEPPIFLAADRDHMRIVKYLMTRGANITMTDRHNNNILYISARKGSIALAEFLLDERKVPFNVNWKNKLNMTIVHYAARFDQLTFLKYIIGRKKADVNVRDKSGRTALHLAAEANNFDALKYLLKQGANAEPEDIYGRKPWQMAAEPKIIDYLKTYRYKRSVVQQLFAQNQTNHFLYPSSVNQSHGHREIGERTTAAVPSRSPSGFHQLDLVLALVGFGLRQVTRYHHSSSQRTNSSTLAKNVRKTVDESEIDSLALDVVHNAIDVYSSDSS